MQPASGIKGFLTSAPGKALLLAVGILATAASFTYLGIIVAIPVILLVGLALPIWVGLKRPRYLALTGLVLLVVAGAIIGPLLTQEVMIPSAAVSSSPVNSTNPYSMILQNASVSPFNAGPGTNFTWTVTVYPQYIPKGNTTPLWLNLNLMNIAGALAQTLNFTHFKANSIVPVAVVFRSAIATAGIWSWQMNLSYRSITQPTLTFVLLNAGSGFNAVEGPVVGSFLTTLGSVFPGVYLSVFLYLGIPFFFVLLIYLFLKNRQRRRQEAESRAHDPPTHPDGSPRSPEATASTAGGGTIRPNERSCPNCGAVVYSNEASCWKCGASLASGGPAPHPSS
ncbi:MAG: hypothetical protein ACYCW9_03945, partial [Thermoplasmata archaeon]